MKRLVSHLWYSGLVVACSTSELMDPAPSPPPPPPPIGFAIFGIVRGIDGVPVPGATAELIQSSTVTRSASTTESGNFSFEGIRGPVTIRVMKGGFSTQQTRLDVTADVVSLVVLVPLPPATSLPLGVTLRDTVRANAGPCDPVSWDARSPCRRFLFSPPESGTLLVTLTWSGPPDLDVTLLTADGAYLAVSDPGGVGQVFLRSPVTRNEVYDLRINSYYGAQTFQLRADVIP